MTTADEEDPKIVRERGLAKLRMRKKRGLATQTKAEAKAHEEEKKQNELARKSVRTDKHLVTERNKTSNLINWKWQKVQPIRYTFKHS